MAKRTFSSGATSQTIDIFIQDSSSTIGAGLSGLVFNTAGLTAYYRKGATGTPTAITLATLATVGTAWSSGGFIELDATHMKGMYRLDVPDTVFASTPWATLYLYGATNMAPVALEVEIVSYNPFDGVRLGLTALPNVASGSAGAIPTTGTGANQISVSSGQVIIQAGTSTGQLDFTSGVVKANVTQFLGTTSAGAAGYAGIDWGHVNAPSTSVNLSATTVNLVNTVTTVTNQLSAAAIATGVWQDATAGDFTVASSIGKSLYIANVAPGAAGGHFIAGSNAATSIATALTANIVGNITGNLSGSVGSVTARVTANVDQIDGASWSTHASGMAPADLRDIAGVAVSTSTAQLGVNVVNVKGVASAGAAGYMGIDWSAINAPTSTQNLSGTTIAAVSGAVSSNVTQWAGSNVLAPNVAGVPRVDVSYFKGTASAGAAGYAGIDWSAINAPTTVVGLSGTTIKTATDLATAIAALPTANQNASALLTYTDGIATGITPQGAWRVTLAAVSGVSNGFTGFPATIHYRDPANTKNVITANVDAVGNRSSVTLDTT